MVRCLLISHGNIAPAFVEASRRIAGECENVFTLNCDALGPTRLQERIAHLIESSHLEDGLFILVSLRGGSCWHAAAKIAREHERVKVISGLNLSLLLSFITKHKKYRFEELGEVMLADGIRGISHL
ncbi:MAG: hypothetical protein O7G31_02375 [Calditrichaeota bacterium]|nr:hypothetical protein [Calditrichota bacterium]TDI85547.1 MAG: hypothetical protein E2O78_04370 [Caldithrix sp.]